MSKNHVLYAESETGEFTELCEFKPINLEPNKPRRSNV